MPELEDLDLWGVQDGEIEVCLAWAKKEAIVAFVQLIECLLDPSFTYNIIVGGIAIIVVVIVGIFGLFTHCQWSLSQRSLGRTLRFMACQRLLGQVSHIEV